MSRRSSMRRKRSWRSSGGCLRSCALPIAAEARRIRHTALALAEVDVLAALAISRRCAIIAGRNFPTYQADDSADIEIVAGRHPVIEQQELAGSNERFVPNDLVSELDYAYGAGSHRSEHGRKINLSAPSGTDRDSGADGIVRSSASARLGVVDRVYSPASAPATIWRAGVRRSWSK